MIFSERRSILKIKLFAITLLLAMCLSSCYNDVEVSDESSLQDVSSDDASDESSQPGYDRSEVAALLFNDKTVHKIFAGGYLNGGETCDEYTECDPDSEYAAFDSIIELLNQTYDASSGAIVYYLDYPRYGKNSVIEGDGGKTLFYYHYIDDRDISISGFTVSDDGYVTVGDRTVQLIYTDDGLRLCDTLYGTPQYDSPVGALMSQGSASTLGGRYLAVALMMSEGEYSLSDTDEDVFLNMLTGSLSNVSGIASQYGGDIAFDTSVIRFAHSDVFDGGFELDMMLAATSFHSLEGLVSSQCELEGYDGFFVVVYSTDVEGVTYTAYYDGLPDVNMCERVIAGENADADSISAGIFALFGAEMTEEALIEYLGDDIMSGGEGLNTVNAYRVGLLDELDKQLCEFIK